MCIHPKDNKGDLDLNKLLDELNNSQTDMDELHEFAIYHSSFDDFNLFTADLQIMHLNIRSMVNKQSDLFKLLQYGKIDICMLNETWLNKTNVELINLNGYKFESNERNTPKKGGGVGICISKALKYVRRSDLELKFPGIEMCIIEIIGLHRNLKVISLYRPPISEAKSFLESCSSLLSIVGTDRHKDIVVGTDHNFDLLKSGIHQCTQDFMNLFLDNDMWPTIMKPTRITKSSTTLIDNIFVSSRIYSHHSSGILVDDISDHFPCLLLAEDLKLKKKEKAVITSRKITPKTIDLLKCKLNEAPLSTVATCDSIDIAFDKLHEKIISIVNSVALLETYVPDKKLYRKEPWLPASILKSIKLQKKLYTKTLSITATQQDLFKYKNYQNTLTKLKRYCKCNYYQDKCLEFKQNTKAMWGLLNKITGKLNDKSSIVEYLEVNGVHLCMAKEIDGAFNNHFSSVGKNYANAIKKSNQDIALYLSKLSINSKSVYFHPTTKHEIHDLIMKLPNKKSSGYDQLNNILIKNIVTELEDAICILFNRSLRCGVFPSSMKLAEVVSLYKNKEKCLCNNYRPISLLITMSKVLEKLVYKRTYSFLNNTMQIYDSQYGF